MAAWPKLLALKSLQACYSGGGISPDLFLALSDPGYQILATKSTWETSAGGPEVWLPGEGKHGPAKLLYVDGHRLCSAGRRNQPISCPSPRIILFVAALWLGCTKID